jgi:hypothetical protein
MADQQWAHVVDSVRVVRDLVAAPEVAAQWTGESSCAGMTVGGLAVHTASQADHLGRLLGHRHDQEPIPLLEHYRRAAWSNSGLDSEANAGIRDGSNAEAEVGHDAALAQVDAWLATLEKVVDGEVPGTVHIPWQGWSLTTEDFVATRLMEMVVHSDDLAAGVGLPTPEFPERAVAETMRLLTAVAVDRHGQAAVVRALSRPQRAPASVSAF